MLKQKIKELAQAYKQSFIDIRRHLHSHPELSYQEHNTSKFIQEQLASLGIPFEVMATTGVVGIIKGKNPDSRVLALRADMDALPITEENDIDYKSQNEGVMHACGHDVHTTCLLGAARILQELKDEWQGTIKLVFQLGEERNPGGASLMIKAGALKNPAPSAIIAMHVNPLLPVGEFSFRQGRVMASADEVFINIRGKGGHAAAPHMTRDVIVIASELILSLQQVISRNCDPFSPSVLSICSFQAGNTTNVIPSKVELKGTFRAMDETWRNKAHELIKSHTKGLVEALGAEAEAIIDVGYPCVDNDDALTQQASKLAKEMMGAEKVSETEMRMGAEDFGYYTQLLPGCFFRLGTRNEAKGIVHNVHTPKFNIDEDAIELGVAMMAWLGAQIEVTTSDASPNLS